MLSIEHQQIIEGYTVFRDAQNELQYYYLPSESPQIADNGRKLHYVVYTDGELIEGDTPDFDKDIDRVGGFLTLEVELGPDDRDLEKIRDKLNSQVGQEVRLAQVPFKDGSVKLMVFGKDGSNTEPSSQQSSPNQLAEVTIAGSVKPSLYGSQTAVFSLRLGGLEAQVMWSLLKEKAQTQVGIVYELEYLGLMPAYNLEITVDFKATESFWDHRLTAAANARFGDNNRNVVAARVDVNWMIRELINEGAIVVKETVYSDDGNQSTQTNTNDPAHIELVKKLISPQLFQPTPIPNDNYRAITENTSVTGGEGNTGGTGGEGNTGGTGGEGNTGGTGGEGNTGGTGGEGNTGGTGGEGNTGGTGGEGNTGGTGGEGNTGGTGGEGNTGGTGGEGNTGGTGGEGNTGGTGGEGNTGGEVSAENSEGDVGEQTASQPIAPNPPSTTVRPPVQENQGETSTGGGAGNGEGENDGSDGDPPQTSQQTRDNAVEGPMINVNVGYTLRRRQLSEQIKRTFVFNKTQAKAHKIYPQGLLEVKGTDFDPDTQAMHVILGEGPFKEIKIEARASFDFEEYAIQEAIVHIAYGYRGAEGDKSRRLHNTSVTLTRNQSRRFVSFFVDQYGTLSYDYYVEFIHEPGKIIGTHETKITSRLFEDITEKDISVNIEDHSPLMPVEIQAGDLQFSDDAIRSVQVYLAPDKSGNGRTTILNASSAPLKKYLIYPSKEEEYDYFKREEFFFQGERLNFEYEGVKDSQAIINTPAARIFNIRPHLINSFNSIQQALVDVAYENGAKQSRRTTLNLTPATPNKAFPILLEENDPRNWKGRTRFVLNTGEILRGDWITYQEPQPLINLKSSGIRVIQLMLLLRDRTFTGTIGAIEVNIFDRENPEIVNTSVLLMPGITETKAIVEGIPATRALVAQAKLYRIDGNIEERSFVIPNSSSRLLLPITNIN